MPKIYGNSRIGKGCYIAENVIIGHPGKEEYEIMLRKDYEKLAGAVIGDECVLRDFGVIYSNVVLGDRVKTGHHYLVREGTEIGSNTLIGSGVVIDNKCRIGDNVSIQSGVYIPTNTVIEGNVFIGPRAVLTNDKYPLRIKKELEGPIVKKNATIGANSVLLPGITVEEGAFIASGAVVTKDVPAWKLAIGVPARILELPEKLKVPNEV